MRNTTSKLFLILFISLFGLSFISLGLNLGNAWDRDSIIAPANIAPVIDGVKDDIWDDANNSVQSSTGDGFPAVRLYVMINSSYFYVLVEVRVSNHNDYEYLKLLLSNSSDSEDSDFIDAKVIQNYNFTNPQNRTHIIEDQVLNNSEYINDTSINFEGVANISGINNYSYYEFKIPFASINDDNVNDTSIYTGNSYAIKLQYGYNKNISNSEYTEKFSPPIEVQVGIAANEENFSYTPYKIDMELLSNIMFIISIIAFAVIFIMSFMSKRRVG
ncbi:MAG: hypothetical protein ACTSU2_04665 [Promethearchaeota archaeon]